MASISEIRCNGCGQIIGRLVDVDGQQWLQVGQVIARSCHGVCAKCGHVFNWHIADWMLAELAKKVLQNRESMLQLEQKSE